MAGVFFPLIWLAGRESRRGWVSLFQEELGENEDLKGEDEAGHPSKEVDIGFGVADFEFEPVFGGVDFCRQLMFNSVDSCRQLMFNSADFCRQLVFNSVDFCRQLVFDGFEIGFGSRAVFRGLKGKPLGGRFDVGFCCGLGVDELGQGGDLLVGEPGFA
jgi:hypothetical protein